MTHGSKSHRQPGSIGASATPSRVFPQQKMPGHLGDERVKIRQLTVCACAQLSDARSGRDEDPFFWCMGDGRVNITSACHWDASRACSPSRRCLGT